jgi:hypothetical protein
MKFFLTFIVVIATSATLSSCQYLDYLEYEPTHRVGTKNQGNSNDQGLQQNLAADFTAVQGSGEFREPENETLIVSFSLQLARSTT